MGNWYTTLRHRRYDQWQAQSWYNFNKEVNLFLLEHFQDKIQFCESEQANKSLIAFSSNLEMRDVIKK